MIETVLTIENWKMPKALRIGCSHPTPIAITYIGSNHATWLCPSCTATWMEVACLEE